MIIAWLLDPAGWKWDRSYWGVDEVNILKYSTIHFRHLKIPHIYLLLEEFGYLRHEVTIILDRANFQYSMHSLKFT